MEILLFVAGIVVGCTFLASATKAEGLLRQARSRRERVRREELISSGWTPPSTEQTWTKYDWLTTN